MPIEHARGWTLCDIVHGLRVYTRTESVNANTVTLQASATKIKASSAVRSLLTLYNYTRIPLTRCCSVAAPDRQGDSQVISFSAAGYLTLTWRALM